MCERSCTQASVVKTQCSSTPIIPHTKIICIRSELNSTVRSDPSSISSLHSSSHWWASALCLKKRTPHLVSKQACSAENFFFMRRLCFLSVRSDPSSISSLHSSSHWRASALCLKKKSLPFASKLAQQRTSFLCAGYVFSPSDQTPVRFHRFTLHLTDGRPPYA